MVAQIKTKLFIDFDDTLFNTAQLKVAITEVFLRLGYTKTEIDQAYIQARGDNYTIERHYNLLSINTGRIIDVSKLWDEINSLEDKLLDFSFPETKSLLEGVNRDRYEIFLLTYGDAEFQKWKVNGAGLDSYFDNNHLLTISHEGKAEEVGDLLDDSEDFIMVDNSLSELQIAKDIFGDRAITVGVSDGKLSECLNFLNGMAEGEGDLAHRY